jgi:hypothetical protein
MRKKLNALPTRLLCPQMVALDALTTLLVGLRVHETDPRILKVHVQRLYRDLDPRVPAPTPGAGAGGSSGSGSGALAARSSQQLVPELHHRVAASDCLRCGAPGRLVGSAANQASTRKWRGRES